MADSPFDFDFDFDFDFAVVGPVNSNFEGLGIFVKDGRKSQLHVHSRLDGNRCGRRWRRRKFPARSWYGSNDVELNITRHYSPLSSQPALLSL